MASLSAADGQALEPANAIIMQEVNKLKLSNRQSIADDETVNKEAQGVKTKT